jgi:hypothetical protein
MRVAKPRAVNGRHKASHEAGPKTTKGKTMSKPTHYVYAVKDRGAQQTAIWTRIGAAWQHEKGDGFNIELEALPLNFTGKLVLRTPKAETETASGEG